MEPDHSGWIEDFKKVNNDFKIVCTKKAVDLVKAFFDRSEEIIVVKDNDTLDLGKGHVLKFIEIPNVHWPETMVTFDTLTGTLFSCDAFGSFGMIKGNHFDDLLTPEEIEYFEKETVRYYSNIVAAYSPAVKNAIIKCKTLPIKILAPGHGIIWRNNPTKIIEEYEKFASFQKGPANEEITVIWGSMYGMTEKAVKHVIDVLENEKIKYHVHRVPEDSWGTVLASAWTSTGIILGMPTYEYKMFPPMAATLAELGKKKVLNRKAFRFGSYGWSGGAEKEMMDIINRYSMNWEFLESVEFKGAPREKDLKLIEERVKELVKIVREAVKKG